MGKYSSIGFVNKSGTPKGDRRRSRRIERHTDGGTAGIETDHWNYRVDAVAFPQAVRPKPRVQEG